MSKPSEVIVLVEDRNQQQLIYRFLIRAGLTSHDMRFNLSPPGAGSGEQWVRNQYANQVVAYRKRQSRAETRLIVVVDADTTKVEDRKNQLALSLSGAEHSPVAPNEQIAHLIPKRNVETWVLCLGGQTVNETTDYKRTQDEWQGLIRNAGNMLYNWARPGAPIPTNCVSSLGNGIAELTRLTF